MEGSRVTDGPRSCRGCAALRNSAGWRGRTPRPPCHGDVPVWACTHLHTHPSSLNAVDPVFLITVLLGVLSLSAVSRAPFGLCLVGPQPKGLSGSWSLPDCPVNGRVGRWQSGPWALAASCRAASVFFFKLGLGGGWFGLNLQGRGSQQGLIRVRPERRGRHVQGHIRPLLQMLIFCSSWIFF